MAKENLSVVKTVPRFSPIRELLEGISAGLATELQLRQQREAQQAAEAEIERETMYRNEQLRLEQEKLNLMRSGQEGAQAQRIAELDSQIRRLEEDLNTAKNDVNSGRNRLDEINQEWDRRARLQRLENIMGDLDNEAAIELQNNPSDPTISERFSYLKVAVQDLFDQNALTPKTMAEARNLHLYGITPEDAARRAQERSNIKLDAERQAYEGLRGPSPAGEITREVGRGLWEGIPGVGPGFGAPFRAIGKAFQGRELTPEERKRKAQELGLNPSLYDTLNQER